MIMYTIPKTIAGRKVEFKSFHRPEKGTVQIQMVIPDVLQQCVLSWKLEPKWFFIVDVKMNSVHDKQKKFTEKYFSNFVEKFMWHIKRNEKTAKALVSEETDISHLFGQKYSLDSLKGRDIFYNLSEKRFEEKVERFGWQTEIKDGSEPLKFRELGFNIKEW